MKTAISIPDALFDAAEEQVRRTGVSRSAFYASAVERYLEQLLAQDLTSRIDEALRDARMEADDSGVDAAAHGRSVVANASW